MGNFYGSLSKNSYLLDVEKYQKMVKKIPINPIVTDELLKELKAVPTNEKPLDLIFVIKYKNSSNNRIYTTECYQSIVKQILTSPVIIPVCYGHQSTEEFNYKARPIAGSVIGALLDEKKELIYYRIIPDSSPNNADIRKWLRNKQLNALSIWGVTDSEVNAEGVEIVKDFLLRSIDLVPPLSEGQENVEVIIGEQKKQENTFQVQNQNDSNNTNENGVENNNKETDMEDKDVKTIDNNVLLSEVKERLLDGRLSGEKAGSELERAGFVSRKLLDEVKQKNAFYETERSKIFDELKELNITTIESLLDFIKQKKALDKETKDKSEFEKNYNEVLQEKGLLKDGKPTGAMHEFVVKWSGCKVGMTKGEMASRVDKVLNDEQFKKIATANIGSPKMDVSSSSNNDSTSEIYSI